MAVERDIGELLVRCPERKLSDASRRCLAIPEFTWAEVGGSDQVQFADEEDKTAADLGNASERNRGMLVVVLLEQMSAQFLCALAVNP